jgi:hypothetical protein
MLQRNSARRFITSVVCTASPKPQTQTPKSKPTTITSMPLGLVPYLERKYNSIIREENERLAVDASTSHNNSNTPLLLLSPPVCSTTTSASYVTTISPPSPLASSAAAVAALSPFAAAVAAAAASSSSTSQQQQQHYQQQYQHQISNDMQSSRQHDDGCTSLMGSSSSHRTTNSASPLKTSGGRRSQQSTTLDSSASGPLRRAPRKRIVSPIVPHRMQPNLQGSQSGNVTPRGQATTPFTMGPPIPMHLPCLILEDLDGQFKPIVKTFQPDTEGNSTVPQVCPGAPSPSPPPSPKSSSASRIGRR